MDTYLIVGTAAGARANEYFWSIEQYPVRDRLGDIGDDGVT